MKANNKSSATYRVSATILALIFALSLAVPAHAKDAWINPDGFTGTLTVSTTTASTPSGR